MPGSVLQLCTKASTCELAQEVGGSEACPKLVLLVLLPPVLCTTLGRGTAQHFRTGSPPPCLSTSTLAPSNLFSHIAQGSQSGPVFSLPASICRGDGACGTFPRDASEALYQKNRLHHKCKTHICPLVTSFHQGDIQDGKWLMVHTLEDELASVVGANKSLKSTRLYGPWKRAALCASWAQMRFSELMSRSSLIQIALDNVILPW